MVDAQTLVVMNHDQGGDVIDKRSHCLCERAGNITITVAFTMERAKPGTHACEQREGHESAVVKLRVVKITTADNFQAPVQGGIEPVLFVVFRSGYS